ncbi:MAG TPA: hypothetical protein VFO76_05200 [Candidatus Kapabacteria bacterium]|nr:hypothetical protein [Candidatus Kapabacteria bacterium]
MEPFTKLFYDGYFHEYFKIRMLALRHYLKFSDEYKQFLGTNNDLEEHKIIDALKLEIRGTYFHAIETLFELIFAIEGKHDSDIWHRLASSDFTGNYKRISTIATGSMSEWEINVSVNGSEVPFLHYAINFCDSYEDNEDTRNNLSFIQKFMIAIAKDFSQRDDYNAYKHGLRLFPTFIGLQAWNDAASIGFDFGDCYTIMKKEDPYKAHIITFDPERDLRMIGVCSEMISNIVLSRRTAFNNKTECLLYYWYKLDFDEITEPRLTTKSSSFSFRPVYKQNPTDENKKES